MELKQNVEMGENINLHDILIKGKELPLTKRVAFFAQVRRNLALQQQDLYMRRILSAADREVQIWDPYSKKKKKMLMFGSNNYLGLANHPQVKQEVRKAIDRFGVGLGGPPLLNGYTQLHRELEERLSHLKHSEATLIFPTGYSANVGLITALTTANDRVIFDALSHASFHDGLRMAKVTAETFAHNDVTHLEQMLRNHSGHSHGETFVGVEGLYSMDGDLAPLDRIVTLCREYGAILMVDDAHGTGVMGENGSGTAEHFGVSKQIDIQMGTFSKTFGVAGGFISASKPLVDYLRFFARSYMFSASLPPVVVAAVLAGLKVLEQEPQLRKRLHQNVAYAAAGLRKLGFDVHPQAAIIPLRVPETMNIRKAAYRFHQAGIFINSIEYPAVPLSMQRFRISIMATHTREDIDRLLQCVAEIFTAEDCYDHNSIKKVV